MFCEHCGHPLAEAATFCGSCGRPRRHAAPGLDPGAGAGFARGFGAMESVAAAAPVDLAQGPRPWVRYFARMFDLALFTMVVWGALFAVAPTLEEDNAYIDNFVNLACFAAWMFVEPLFLAASGATPGKALFRTRVIDARGGRLDYGRALVRSIRVWWRGLGAGFPITSIVTLIIANNRLNDSGTTSWDRDGGTRVEHRRIGAGRAFIIALLVIGFFVLAVVGSLPES